MTSYKVITVIMIVFLTTALIASYAGFETTIGISDLKASEEQQQEALESGENRNLLASAWSNSISAINRWIGERVPVLNGIGYVMALSSFMVPGAPMVLQIVFFSMSMILVLTLSRITIGALAGGGG